MSVRTQNLDAVGAVYATFDIYQNVGLDELDDDDIGKAVTMTGSYECGFGSDGGVLLGKLVAISPTNGGNGERKATVQVAGIMTLPMVETNPTGGNRVVVDGSGSIKQAPALGGNDPAGGNVGRGTVIAVNGTSSATLILN
ncbi:MAG: hypothetical protein GF307_11735 [candidate division Zixibacteria bacterium]|nr:hypothetical protein [candidate division Zixibacteria bacterium]